MASKLAFGQVLAGLTEGIAEGIRFNKQMDLKERELAIREQNTKDAALFREEQFGLSKEKFEISQKQFGTREKRLERAAGISAGREAFNQGDDLRRDIRDFSRDINDTDKELFELLQRREELGKGEFSLVMDERITSLESRRELLSKEKEGLTVRLDTLVNGDKSFENKKATEKILKSDQLPLSASKKLLEGIATAQTKEDLGKIFRASLGLPFEERVAIKKLSVAKARELTTGVKITPEGALEQVDPEIEPSRIQ